MGHVVNPISLRLGHNRTWNSSWATNSLINYSYLIQRDLFLYNFLKLFFNNSTLITNKFLYSHSKIISRYNGKFDIIIYLYAPLMLNKIKLLLILLNRLVKLIPDVIHNNELVDSKIRKISKIERSLRFDLIKVKSNLSLNTTMQLNDLELIRENQAIIIDEVLKKLYKFIEYCLYNTYYIKTLFYSLKLLTVILKRWLIMVSPNFKSYNLSFIFLSNDQLTPQIITFYIIKKLKQRNLLFKILKPIFKNLQSNIFISGYKVSCSGRFTRKQRATYYWVNKGLVPLNRFKATVDYSFRDVSLQFGSCGVKVWLCRKI